MNDQAKVYLQVGSSRVLAKTRFGGLLIRNIADTYL